MDKNKTIFRFCSHVIREAAFANQRTGQYLYNILPDKAQQVIVGTSFDPFYHELSKSQLHDWVEHHLEFDGNNIVRVVNNGHVLWRGWS